MPVYQPPSQELSAFAARVRAQVDPDMEGKTEEEKEDALVQAASRPSLATLFKRGLNTGVLKPAYTYTS